MGDPTPASTADECPSTSTRGSSELKNIFSTIDTESSGTSSESNDDESDNEQSDTTTTEPLVALHTNDDGEKDASDAQDTLHPAVSSGDFQALKQERYLTDREKYFLMKHSFVPSPGYSFPSRIISGSVRHFQHRWLTSYNGLVYSESADGGFCKFCVLFAKCTSTMKELGIFVSKPFTNFKKAAEKLEHFHGKKFHKIVDAAMTFMQIQNKRMLSIDQQLSVQRTAIAQNRLSCIQL